MTEIAIEFRGSPPDLAESVVLELWRQLSRGAFSAAIRVYGARGFVQLELDYPDGTSSFIHAPSLSGALMQGLERRRAYETQPQQ